MLYKVYYVTFSVLQLNYLKIASFWDQYLTLGEGNQHTNICIYIYKNASGTASLGFEHRQYCIEELSYLQRYHLDRIHIFWYRSNQSTKFESHLSLSTAFRPKSQSTVEVLVSHHLGNSEKWLQLELVAYENGLSLRRA